jgi:hypothetical protein
MGAINFKSQEGYPRTEIYASGVLVQIIVQIQAIV